MTPFDIKLAKKGATLITRNNKSARIICYDRLTGGKVAPIIALIKNEKGTFETLAFYNVNGQNADGVKELDLAIND